MSNVNGNGGAAVEEGEGRLAGELDGVAKRIRDWQSARGLSDGALCKRFAGLGSTKTFKKILDGELEGLAPERWLLEYQQVWGLMEIASANAGLDEPVYDDFRNVTRARLAVTDAMGERGNNRVVIVEGAPGTGKTTAGLCLAERFGRKIVWSEADELWKDSPGVMLGGLLRALKVRSIPANPDDRKVALLEVLKVTPCVVVIDDAHHFGPRNLNICKTLINQTPVVLILLAVETLWERLESGAYEEARQLTRNRLCERVQLQKPDAEEVKTFLQRRGISVSGEDGKVNGQLGASAKVLASQCWSNGNWNFVNQVSRRARRMGGKEGCVDVETFAKAMQQALATR